MEKEDVQETERLVENSLTVDNVKHTQLHIIKAQPMSQVDCRVCVLRCCGEVVERLFLDAWFFCIIS